jgi:hypothetical protein
MRNSVFAAALLALACGGSSTDTAARRDLVIPACTWPAAADTSDAASRTGCAPRSMFQVCEVPSGSVLHGDGTITTPDGRSVTCTSACAPAEYVLTCTGAAPAPAAIPSPAASLGCRAIPIPTPPNALFWCCPCQPG